MSVELRLGAPSSVVSVPLVQGGVLSRSASSFRYRVTFRPNLADPFSQPVLETPMFDDITFSFQSQGGPRFLDWIHP